MATVNVPEVYIFLDAKATRTFLEDGQNIPAGDELGALLRVMPNKDHWFAVFSYEDTGHIDDKERDAIDADALMKTLKKGNEYGNKERQKRGWQVLNLEGWHQRPFYDPATNNLTWATKLSAEGSPSINHSVRLLGRTGTMSVQLVADSSSIDAATREFNDVLDGYTYNQGQRYAEFVKGDKLAGYGLTALIAGGAGAAAVKSGLLAEVLEADRGCVRGDDWRRQEILRGAVRPKGSAAGHGGIPHDRRHGVIRVMIGLLALLWCIYLSECLVRQRPGELVLSARAIKGWRAIADPEIQLLAGRVGFSWTAILPWRLAFTLSGDELDIRKARALVAGLKDSIRWLRIASGALFIWILGGLTVLVITDRLLSVLLPYAIVALLLWALTFAAFLGAFRRVHGQRPALEIWVTAALSPVALIRAPHIVCLSAIKSLHPVAASTLFADDAEFLRVGRLWHFDAPELRPAIERAAKTRALQDQPTAPPATPEPGLARFCPRCHETYTAAAERCADCAEVPLQLLPSHS